LGAKRALVLNPETPVERLLPYLDEVDEILVMTVHPGYGGQKFIESSLEKVKLIRSWDKDIDIEIDGGINVDNVALAVKSGANVIVAGSAIYGQKDISGICSEFFNRGNLN
jgi:ribulose-phosphate 3-epimerase